MMNYQQNIDNLVLEFFGLANDAILQGRTAQVQPITSNTTAYTDNNDYINQTLQAWKKQLTKPLTLDLYIFSNQSNSHVLMERWNFNYQVIPNFIDNSTQSTISLRFQTFLRSLNSIIRMLPGYNLLGASQKQPLISFQIYDPKIAPSNFKNEHARYEFPKISSSKGYISVSVTYILPQVMKAILKSLNGGVLIGIPSPGSIKKESRPAASAAIPIPTQNRPQSYDARPRTTSADSREYQRMSFQVKDSDIALLRPADYNPSAPRSLDSRFTLIDRADQNSFNPGSTPTGIFGTSPNQWRQSFPNQQAASLNSTPPFAYAPVHDLGAASTSSGGTSYDTHNRPILPYYQVSASLTSPSPSFVGPSQLTLLMERRPSFRKATTNNPSGAVMPNTIGSQSIELENYRPFRFGVLLPNSPFINREQSSASSKSSVNTDTTGNSHKLDIVMKLERDKERRNTEIYFDFDHSSERNRSLSETTREDDTTIDKNSDYDTIATSLEDDLPFAWRPSTGSMTGGASGITSSLVNIVNRRNTTLYDRSHVNNNNNMSMLTSDYSNTINNGITLNNIVNDLNYRLNELKQFRNIKSNN